MGYIETLRESRSLTDVLRLKREGKFNDYMVTAGLVAETIVQERHGRNFGALRGLTIIDVGCGGNADEGDGYLPYFPLLASLHGATVVGIDRIPYVGEGRELYRHVVYDLYQQSGPLNFSEISGLTNADVVTCTGLTGGFALSPSLLFQDDYDPLQEFLLETKIFVYGKEILTRGGFIVYNNRVHYS